MRIQFAVVPGGRPIMVISEMTSETHWTDETRGDFLDRAGLGGVIYAEEAVELGPAYKPLIPPMPMTPPSSAEVLLAGANTLLPIEPVTYVERYPCPGCPFCKQAAEPKRPFDCDGTCTNGAGCACDDNSDASECTPNCSCYLLTRKPTDA